MTHSVSDRHLPGPCRDNISCIDQLQRVVEAVSDSQYTQAVAPCDSGIGVHIRHVLDHYDAFFNGLESGLVDYDQRDRDVRTECSRPVALQRLLQVRQQLAMLDADTLAHAVDVRMDCGSNCGTKAPSSVCRELQFLVSHTVHHDALIAAAITELGMTIESGFGIAPSTLRYVRGTQQTG